MTDIVDAYFNCILECGDLFAAVLITLVPCALILFAIQVIRSICTDV